MRKSFLFLADGFEEVEALGVVDVLRRGTIEVKTVSISDKKEVTGAHGVPVVADLLLSDVKEEEAEFLICPGGMPGAKNLGDCTALVQMIQKHFDKGGYVAAICAAPALVLSKIKMNKRYTMTCYPGFEEYLPEAEMQPHGVVVDGNVITGEGPAYAFKFGLAILEQLTSKKWLKKLRLECYWINMKNCITLCIVLLCCLQGIGQNTLLRADGKEIRTRIVPPKGICEG